MLGNPAISLYLILISQTHPYGSIHQPPPHHNNPPAGHGEASHGPQPPQYHHNPVLSGPGMSGLW